jgi:predicted dehydrogenase
MASDGRDRTPVRIGVLSAEHVHASKYVSVLASIAGARLVGVWDHDPRRAAIVAGSAATRAFDDIEELLASVDGVVITSANAFHRQLVERAAAAGVHVLCEKPLATTVEDARAIVNACGRADVRLMTAFPMRWNAAVRSLEATMRSGALGRPVFLEGANTGKMPDGEAGWFVDPALSGGGAVTDHVVHLVDVYRWILQSEVVEVYAVANRILQDRFTGVETGGLVSLRFADGVLATIDCSWSKPQSYPAWGGLSIDAVGTGGAFRVDAFRQRLVVYGTGEVGVSWNAWGPDADVGMLEEFLAVVRENREPVVTGFDGLRAVEIVDAAYRSIATGGPVSLATRRVGD